jgi:hypothetical protein
MRKPAWLAFGAAAIIAILAAALLVISRAPVPEVQGTAPSVITDTTGAEAEPLTGPGAQQEPREAPGSSTAARAARGSGVEGVTSGGVTVDPPGRR